MNYKGIVVLAAIGAVGCDQAATMLKKCESLQAKGEYGAAIESCTKASGFDSEAASKAKALLPQLEEQARAKAAKEEAARIRAENAMPEKVTEQWCEVWAQRYRSRVLAKLNADESTKKHSQRKTEAYLQQITDDAVKSRTVYCKDDAGEPNVGYFACTYRTPSSDYDKCDDAEDAYERIKVRWNNEFENTRREMMKETDMTYDKIAEAKKAFLGKLDAGVKSCLQNCFGGDASDPVWKCQTACVE